MANKPIVSLPAAVVGMKPRQDRSWRIDFETRELGGDDVAILADNFQGEGWLVFKPNSLGIELDDIPEGEAEPGTKRPSQRLRAVIMVLWKQKGAKGDPEAFYRTMMEKFIEGIKDKLEEEN